MSASRMSLLTRVGATAAAAALATSGAMVASSAADASAAHVRKLHTSLSIRKVNHPKLGFDVIRGSLHTRRVPLRDKIVYLESRTKGTKFAVVAQQLTHKHGGWVAFKVTPTTTATRYVLVFKGSPNFRHSHSGVVTVKAKA
jgi:hypothetical protein